MRLMTFNIWNYTAPWPLRRQLIADTIVANDPDVVALQETRHDFRFEGGRSQGEQIADLSGRAATIATAQVYWPLPGVDEGLTILTRGKPEDVAVVRFERLRTDRADENHRILLAVAVSEDGRRVWVGDTHFSLSPAARMSNAAEVSRFAAAHPGPLVVMGDLNAEPESEALAVLRANGLSDAWEAAGEGNGHTYPSQGPVRRIDYILTRGLEVQNVALVGDQPRNGVYPSDHLGIVADVRIPV